VRRLLTRAAAIIPAVLAIALYGEQGTGELLVLSQVVLSLQLSFAVIPLIHLVSDRRWMGQYTIGPWTTAASWLVAIVIAALNLKLAWDEVGGWLQVGGVWQWLIWATVLPVSFGLVALLAYVSIVPAVQRSRRIPIPESQGVHGISAMPEIIPPRAPRRIVATLDFTDTDTAVLSQTVSIARTAGRSARVVLLHVVESTGARMLGAELSDAEAQSDQQRLELYVTELTELGVDAVFDLGFGDPADELALLIEQHRPDLVVIGSHGHKGVGDLVHGTTVESLRHRVSVPLLVVPAGRAAPS
jgi:manganese transport protein